VIIGRKRPSYCIIPARLAVRGPPAFKRPRPLRRVRFELAIRLGEKPAKIFPAAGNAAFHRPHAYPEDFRQSLIRVVRRLRKREDFTLLSAELPHAQCDMREELFVRRRPRRVRDITGDEVRQAHFLVAAGGAVKRVVSWRWRRKK